MKKPKAVGNASSILTEDYMKSAAGVKTYQEVMQETGLKKSTIFKYARLYGVEFKKEDYSGENSSRWKGGRYEKKGRGYMVRVDDHDLKYPYRPEHVVLMEQSIGRKLKSDEVVHHIDGNPYNNDLNNLLLLNKLQHDRFHLLLGSLQVDHRNMTKEQVLYLIENMNKVANFVIKLCDNVC